MFPKINLFCVFQASNLADNSITIVICTQNGDEIRRCMKSVFINDVYVCATAKNVFGKVIQH